MPENFEIPDAVTTIGQAAFAESNLTKLHIKSNVESVGGAAYSKKLEHVEAMGALPFSCKQVEISAPIVYMSFYSVYWLSERETPETLTVIFNEGVKQIRYNNTSLVMIMIQYLECVTFPKSIEAIGNVQFPVNVRVASYVLSENISFLADNAFHDYSIVNCISDDDAQYWRAYPREKATEFECKNSLSQAYVDSKAATWEKTKKLVPSN